MSARDQLLSPWPEKAIAFTTAIERLARLIGRARSAMAIHFELTLPGWRLLRLVEQSGSRATLTRLARGKRQAVSVTSATCRSPNNRATGAFPSWS